METTMTQDKTLAYLQGRIDQLKEDRDKLRDDHISTMWYNRIIQELEWARQVHTEEYTEDCAVDLRDDLEA